MNKSRATNPEQQIQSPSALGTILRRLGLNPGQSQDCQEPGESLCAALRDVPAHGTGWEVLAWRKGEAEAAMASVKVRQPQRG